MGVVFFLLIIGFILEVTFIYSIVIPISVKNINCTLKPDQESNKSEHREYEEKCYDGLGCVVLTPEWTDTKYRPINVLPNERYIVNTIFIQWAFKENITYEILGNSDMRCLPTLSACCQILLIHDFTSNGYTGWVKHIARAILSECSGISVVSVDWSAGAQPPYVQAVANARLVALEIVHYLTKLKITPKKVHLIGHGLGAHIAGYVGKLVSVYKITGLDPSGPYFKGMPPNVRLHKTDAANVEVIHTDSTCIGMDDIIGDVDYFPNDGKNQPGCVDTCKKLTSVERNDVPDRDFYDILLRDLGFEIDLILEICRAQRELASSSFSSSKLGETLSACSHKRALKYYIEAIINPSCMFTGVACSSFKDFLKGKCTSCGDKRQYCHGLRPLNPLRNVNNTNGFFFITADSAPFCGEMLKVLIMLSPKKCPKKGIVKGYFKMTVKQDTEDVSFLLNENHVISALKADAHYMFLVFRAIPPSLNLPAKAIDLKWMRGMSWSTPPRVSNVMISKMTDCNETVQWFCPLSSSSDAACDIDLYPCHTAELDETTTLEPPTTSPEPECFKWPPWIR